MRDDVLGLFGDPAVTGKSSSSRPARGQADACSCCAPSPWRRRPDGPCSNAASATPSSTRTDAERCREVVAACGALAIVETMVRRQHDAALEAIAELPEPAAGALRALASTLTHRAH